MRQLGLFIMMMVCGGFSLPTVCSAAQLGFRIFGDARVVTYQYAWTGHDGQAYKTAFRLSRPDVDMSSGDFKPFDNTAASTYVSEAMQAYAQSRSKAGGDLQVAEVDGRVRMTSHKLDKASFDKEVTVLKSVRAKAMEDYISNQFYTKVNETAIMPDHKRIASLYVRRMRPVAEAVGKASTGRESRDYINTILSFFQSIPYDTLEDRQTSNGAGFVTPIQLLTQNKGDCDSKAVAMAAVLRNLYPKLRIVMVYIPGHAFIGLNMPPKGDEATLKIGKYTFVLAEAVGPAVIPLGKIAPDSYAKLKQSQFSYQEVPF